MSLAWLRRQGMSFRETRVLQLGLVLGFVWEWMFDTPSEMEQDPMALAPSHLQPVLCLRIKFNHRSENIQKQRETVRGDQIIITYPLRFPGGSVVKNLPAVQGSQGLIPGSGTSPGKGNGYPLQYSCLENRVDRGAWRSTVHGVTRSQTQLWVTLPLSLFTH